MRSLKELYSDHKGKVSDKWELYLDKYDQLFESRRMDVKSLLEIGIQNGGSLELWRKYFPNASALVGCDINEDCGNLKFSSANISVVAKDANTDAAETIILGICPEYDVVIDDGSHTSGDIVKSFIRYFPYVAQDGIFIAEDLHCSYWSEFDGGLFDSDSSISFFKALVDIVNYEHWGLDVSRDRVLWKFLDKYKVSVDSLELEKIHSIEFFNSTCVIRKKDARQNILGQRYLVGQEASIYAAPAGTHGSYSQSIKQDAHCPKSLSWEERFAELQKVNKEGSEEVNTLKATLKQKQDLLESKEAQLTSLQGRIAELERNILTGNTQRIELESEVDELSRNNKKLQLDVSGYLSEKDFMEIRIRALNSTIRNLEQNNLDVQSEVQRLTALGLRKEANFQNVLSEIYSSRSWRFTKPLRMLGAFFRK